MRGLYLHLPFCAQKCHYCNFVITLDLRDSFRKRFFEALEREMNQIAQREGRLVFDTLYLGGGTPSLLTSEEMTNLMEKIHQHFEVKRGAEITCEFNPGDADVRKIKIFRELGINRVSLGVQAFQNSLLQKTGRLHSVENTYETVQLLKDAGISNLSFDLISGLPGQTLEEFQESLQQTIVLEAKQLSFYDLEIHENTPWGNEQKKSKLKLLDDEARANFFQQAVNRMTQAGYNQYEISTFAKPGFESQHNLIYWHNEEYLGLGPGAYTYLRGVRSQFAPEMGRYLSKCENKDWNPDLADTLTEEEKETETLITALRLPAGVDWKSFPIIRGKLKPRVEELLAGGFLEQKEERTALTARGRALVESVFKALIGKE